MNLTHKIFLLMYVFAINAKAQTYFNKRYPYSTSIANATAVIEVDTGGYIFPTCTFGSFNSLLINRINVSGDTLFTQKYLKPGYSFFGTGASNSIIHTLDNNYVFTVAIADSTGNLDALLVKITDAGDTLWTKSFGGANFDNANKVCETPDSGFVLMGVTQSYSAGAASDFYLIKTDKNGIFLWQKVYGLAGVAEDCVSGQITLDGGFILSGRQSNRFHIVKTDSNGNFQWEKTYGATIGVCFVTQLADSSYILAGAENVAGFGDQGCLIKVNKAGGIIWQKDYGGSFFNEWFYSVPVILNDGSIIVAGEIQEGYGFGLLVKTDSLGNQKWLRVYTETTTSTDDYFYDVKHTADNGFIMSGYSNNGWLVKVDSNGCEVANCNLGVNESDIANLDLTVFPNPATLEINIGISTDNINNFIISIANILGEEQKIEVNRSTISISHLANGLYFITAKSKDGKYLLSQKFIKE